MEGAPSRPATTVAPHTAQQGRCRQSVEVVGELKHEHDTGDRARHGRGEKRTAPDQRVTARHDKGTDV